MKACFCCFRHLIMVATSGFMNSNPTRGNAEGLPCIILAVECDRKPYTLTFVIVTKCYIFTGSASNKLSTWVLSRALIMSMAYFVKTY